MLELLSYEQLAKLRKEHGISADKIAKMLDVTRQTIYNNEKRGGNFRCPLLIAYNVLLQHMIETKTRRNYNAYNESDS